MKKKLVIDVDTGVDDAQAIMVALADPEVEILGITCCHGNTPLDNVLRNTLRVLKVCNRLDVSVQEWHKRDKIIHDVIVIVCRVIRNFPQAKLRLMQKSTMYLQNSMFPVDNLS